MPEGDTIHRLAARLRPLFVGQTLVEVECELAAVDDWKLQGREVARIEARGKNLLIHCAPLIAVEGKPDPREPAQLPAAIWTHLGMNGSWRLGPRDAALPSRRAAIVLRTATHLAACYEPKRLAVLGPRSLLRHPMLARLGPDLLDPEVDLGEAISRASPPAPTVASLPSVHPSHPGDAVARLIATRAELGDAIMRQSAVAGIGNVYKSELLFLEGLSPFLQVEQLEPARLRALLERARKLMQANVAARGPRRTRGDSQAPRQRLWVYKRSGRACYVCGTIIEMRRQGELARSTYYCPRCQGLL
ncbi:MAG: DNA-formamidopyrimidine glycosylase family protein [Enhygromyxa sp.]